MTKWIGSQDGKHFRITVFTILSGQWHWWPTSLLLIANIDSPFIKFRFDTHNLMMSYLATTNTVININKLYFHKNVLIFEIVVAIITCTTEKGWEIFRTV